MPHDGPMDRPAYPPDDPPPDDPPPDDPLPVEPPPAQVVVDGMSSGEVFKVAVASSLMVAVFLWIYFQFNDITL